MSLRTLLIDRLQITPLSGITAQLSSAGESLLTTISAVERELWLVVVLAMLADVPLTLYGLELGLTEMNPVARAAIERTGGLGLYFLEALALGMGVCCTLLIPDRYTALVPLGLALPSVVAVIINTVLITVIVL